ncbi:MAG: lactonase family protein [Chloroflexi bacterium]|nr:lactonase family protein [Chloroflexota bacterium]
MADTDNAGLLVFIGTFTRHALNPRGDAEGVYRARFDSTTGVLTPLGLAAAASNPSYIATDPAGRCLYAIGDMPDADGQPIGCATAFAIDRENGGLTQLNRQPTHGNGPAYVSVDKTGRVVLAVNYRSGSIASFPIQADGALGEAASAVQHHGSGANPERQEGPHAHMITVDPNNRYVLATDLGIDKVMLYRLDPVTATLIPNDPPSAEVAPGSGPRHIAFDPSGTRVYVINELGSTIAAFDYDAERGALSWFQTVSTLPEGFAGKNSTADLQIHPSGRFIYGSNRGHDSIAVFEIDQGSGRLMPRGHVSTQGKTPRNLAFDPSARFLLASNQDSDTIVTFRVNEQTGMPEPTGHAASVPTPVCTRFVPS